MLSVDRSQERLARRAIALVLAGGRGSRLRQLTDRRAKPAVFFGGKFRIIDFAMSNCLNSGIRRIGVLTQYKAHSLLRHLQMGWSFLRPEMNEFLDLLPAQQRIDEATWYRGTADAVFQNFDIFRAARPDYFVVLAGDHIYKMDYSHMLAEHVANGSDCTVACVEVPLAQASEFGVMTVNPSALITGFDEKPKNPTPMIGKPDRVLASMGIYVFTAKFLYAELERDARDATSSHDFGKDVIPHLVGRGLAAAHHFEESCVKTTPEAEPYWRDVGTIDAYWAANLDLVMPVPQLDIYDPNWPILTYQQQLPPAKFVRKDGDRRGPEDRRQAVLSERGRRDLGHAGDADCAGQGVGGLAARKSAPRRSARAERRGPRARRAAHRAPPRPRRAALPACRDRSHREHRCAGRPSACRDLAGKHGTP